MEDYEIKVVKSTDTKYVNQCIEIAKQYPKEIGHHESVIMSDYLICADKKGRVIGFIALIGNDILLNEFYVTQVAVAKSKTRQGIASALLKYVKKHSKGYTRITSDVKKDNIISINLHKKVGFETLSYCSDTKSFKMVIYVDKIADKEFIDYTDESELE